MLRLIYFIFLLNSLSVLAQKSYPKDEFISPMDLKLEPSGTFGELRNNHFHSGLDFKTERKEGFNVYAAADGFVSRIKYSTFGYGKSIYVTHYNGFTTVYAHLQKSAPFIEQYIKSKQYKDKIFEIELFPKKDEIKVFKGQIIGFSGNSGGSIGPHLHYEIRETVSEEIINPLLFGLVKDFKDTQAPLLNNLIAYPLTDSTIVNQSENSVTVSLNKIKDNNFVANRVLANGVIGFGVNSFDTYDGHTNKNGVYKIEMFVNGALYYNVTFDRFSFAETRYINSFIDYELKQVSNDYVQKLFFKNDIPLSLINHNKTKGQLLVQPGDNYSVLINIFDIHNNKTSVTIPVSYSNQPATLFKKTIETEYFLTASRENIYQKENVSVSIPKATFLDDFYFDFDVNKEQSRVKLHRNIIPGYKNMVIEFDLADKINSGLDVEKSFIGEVNKNTIYYLNTTKKGSKFTARTRNLGTYQVLTDEVKPRIYDLSFKQNENLDKVDKFTVYISDDLSGIKEYSGYLNGKWILMDYDYKTKTLIHYFSDNIYEDGKNLLKIIVSDKVGNTAIFDATFYKTKMK